MKPSISSATLRSFCRPRNFEAALWLAACATALVLGGAAPQAHADSISGGHFHSLWVKGGDDSLWAWGDNFYGQLGDGTKVDRSSPVKLAGVGLVAGASGGDRHTIAVRTDGTVLAWGLNDHGQLGDGTFRTRTLPTVLAGITGTGAVAAGRNHSLARKTDGTVWAWGANDSGQVGDGFGGTEGAV